MSTGNSFGVVDQEYTGRRVYFDGPKTKLTRLQLPIYVNDKQQVMVYYTSGATSRLLSVNEYEIETTSQSSVYLSNIDVATGESVQVVFMGAVPYDQASITPTVDSNGRLHATMLSLSNVPTFTNNANAITGGLKLNDIYKTSTGSLMIVY